LTKKEKIPIARNADLHSANAARSSSAPFLKGAVLKSASLGKT
jgi:hypothetical protein